MWPINHQCSSAPAASTQIHRLEVTGLIPRKHATFGGIFIVSTTMFADAHVKGLAQSDSPMHLLGNSRSWAAHRSFRPSPASPLSQPAHPGTLPVDSSVRSFFQASVEFIIGDGGLTQFWTVKAALLGDKWMRHFKANLSAASIVQFSTLWNAVQHTHLTPDQPDTLNWRWTANGCFSAASASTVLLCCRPTSSRSSPSFHGALTRPQLKCQFFVWLAAQGKCLTSNNLAKRGWPRNPICALCACKLLKVPPISYRYAPLPRKFGI